MSIAEKLTTIAENQQRVYDAGKQAEYDRFWDAYQQECDLYGYDNAFSGRGWTQETFKPKYDVETTGAYMLFRRTAIVDLKRAIEESGISFKINSNILQYTFNNTALEVIGGIEFAKPITNMVAAFSYSSNLREVQTLPVSENATNLDAFSSLTALETISFSGTIPVDLALRNSPKLSKASIENIISCLSDTAEGMTLTLSLEAVDNAYANEDEGNIGSNNVSWAEVVETKPNWTISLV